MIRLILAEAAVKGLATVVRMSLILRPREDMTWLALFDPRSKNWRSQRNLVLSDIVLAIKFYCSKKDTIMLNSDLKRLN